MHHKLYKNIGAYVPEHAIPSSPSPIKLKAAVDEANLGEMWDMILTLDYGVSSVNELPQDRQDEFLNVMSLLLQAFDR
ncbi:hypothetical protein [Roseibium sp. MMSF_3544]|uniref:hypothetical protein n=1 Tax=unclassified Roseibium TaxID=2629323 RepID=UPI00273D9EAE|nr:hypothetical protein [Roseibium sp. MMSF_3544]